MPNSITYDSKQKRLIHQMIESLFSGHEFDAFCAKHFPAIFADFSPDSSYPERIQTTIERLAQTKQLGRLVSLIKQTNPDGYAAFEQRAQPGAPPAEAATQPSAPLAMPGRAGNFIQNPEILINESLEDRYRIDAVLDRTGMAAVFKAHDTKFQRDVAIKIIDLTQVEQPAIKERVRQEVQTAMKLDHPGVVKIYDYGQAGDLLYIIMEFIAGQNLREAMQRFGLLNLQTVLPEILHLVRHICLTLGYMHQQGVLHPGVKPGNLMLKPDPTGADGSWQPVLINLGFLRPHREAVINQKDIPVRRLTYSVSPELLLGHATDIRSDIYAVGVIFYELVTGQPPFKPANLTDAVHLHVEEPPRPPRQLKPDLPEAVEQIILKALAKNPADRYLSAQDMAQAIAACLPDSGGKPLPLPAGPASQIIISLEPAQLVVAPGETLKAVMTLYNDGERDDRCLVRVEGVPPAWVSLSPSTVSLAPGQEQAVELTVQPPRAAESKAGNYPMSVQVLNPRDNRQIAETQKVLTVTGYVQFTSTLYPQELEAGQNTTVTVQNQGNRAEVFTVRPKPERGLKFEPDQAQLKLDPGENGTVDFTVIPAQRFVGDTTSQTFSVQVALPQGKAELHSGEVSSRGRVPAKWALGALLTLALFLCGLITLYQTVGDLVPAAATAQGANQATIEAANAANQATRTQELDDAGAATAAAQLAQDPDRDGLTNAQEQEFNTDPNNADTDGDTLTDAQEVQLGTNPLVADTDADGLNDAEEVRIGTRPDERDTDADGVNDGEEIRLGTDPKRQPTPTAVPGASGSGPVGIRFGPGQFQPTQAGEPPRYDVFENVGTVEVGVELTRAASQLVIVRYTVTGLGFFFSDMRGATAGEDFQSNAEGTLTFQPGELSKSIRLEIINDSLAEGPETVRIILTDQSSPPVPVLENEGKVVILDDDS